jgi:hypothetical protein
MQSSSFITGSQISSIEGCIPNFHVNSLTGFIIILVLNIGLMLMDKECVVHRQNRKKRIHFLALKVLHDILVLRCVTMSHISLCEV